MNIILMDKDEIRDGSVAELRGRRAKHIVRVLRARLGDRLTVGVLHGNVGSGTVTGISSKQPYSVRLEVRLGRTPPPLAPVDLVLALPRPIMLRRIVSTVAALGVGRLYIVNAERVEKSYWQSSLLAPARLEDQARKGLEQAVDTRPVEISLHRGFKPFVETILPTVAERYGRLLVAHPGAQTTLGKAMNDCSGPVLAAVGSEGGWSDYEVSRFRELGFVDFGLGPRILSVETAVTAVHAMVTLLLEEHPGRGT